MCQEQEEMKLTHASFHVPSGSMCHRLGLYIVIDNNQLESYNASSNPFQGYSVQMKDDMNLKEKQ